MVEAISAERSDAIAAEIMENPANKMREENEHTKEKVVTIALDFFTKTEKVTSTSSMKFLKLPVKFPFNMLEDSIKREKAWIAEKIQECANFQKIESVVTITVAGSEVFREGKTFDQLGVVAQAS